MITNHAQNLRNLTRNIFFGLLHIKHEKFHGSAVPLVESGELK